jgi:hypothetical protein
MLLNLVPSHSRLREVAVRVSATSAGAEGVPISTAAATHNVRFNHTCYYCSTLTCRGLGDWKLRSNGVSIERMKCSISWIVCMHHYNSEMPGQ